MVTTDTLKKRFLAGSIWSVLFKGLGAILGLSVYALLSRLLTIEEFGTYMLIVSVVSFTAILVQAGMSNVALRLIAESLAEDDLERAAHVLRTTLRIVLFVGVGLALLWGLGVNEWIAIGLFHSKEMANLGWLIACWFVLFAVIRYFSDAYCGEQDFFRANLFQGTATSIITVSLFGLYYLVQLKIDLQAVVLTMVIATLIVAMLAATMMHRRMTLAGSTRLAPHGDIWLIAWPIFISNLSVFVANQADLWILGMLASKEVVALYGVALRTVLLIMLLPLIINSVIQPMIVELYSKGERLRLERLLGSTAMIMFVPSLLMLLIVIFLGDELLSLIYGEQYSEAATILTILCFGRAVNVFTGSCGQCLLMGGQQVLMMRTSVLFSIFSIALALGLFSTYGSIGVASAFAGGMMLTNLTQAYLVKKHMGVSTLASLKWLTSKDL